MAADRRQWLHARLVEMAEAGELPTTVSSLYYDGVGAGCWPSDAEAKRAGRKRMPRQDISDDVQWLIEHEFVDERAVVDLSRSVLDHRAPTDVRQSAYDYVAGLVLSPWGDDEPVTPWVFVESRSLASALNVTARTYCVALAPLGGMSGRTFLRSKVLPGLQTRSPVAFLGDWNPAGHDIEDHLQRTLTEKGWCGEWSMLAVTDADAAALPRVTKRDSRFRPPREYESVEAEALTTTVLRRRLVEWLEDRLPVGFSWAAHESRTTTQRLDVLRRLNGTSP